MSQWIHKAEAFFPLYFAKALLLCGFKNRLLLILSLTILIMSNLQRRGGED